MLALSRHRTFLACAALLALSAGLNFGARPGLAAQSSGAAAGLEELLNAFKWRSIGPDRGGRSIAVVRRQGTAARGVLRRDRRRAVEDDRRRRTMGARHRRPDQELLGRRRRRLRIDPGHRLHRHGRVVHPRQHPAGRRRLQIDRRRQDVDARRLLELRRHLEDPHPPDQSRHRLRRRLRPLRRGQRRARRLQDHRRRQDVEEGAVPQREDRRRRHRDRPPQPERDVRGDVGGVPRRVPDVERRPRQRPVQVDRRRRDVARDHAQPGPAAGRRSARSASMSPAPTRTASTRWSRTRTAASSARTTPARRGRS